MVHASRLTITVHGHPYGSRSNANVIGQVQRSRSSMGPTRPILLVYYDDCSKGFEIKSRHYI